MLKGGMLLTYTLGIQNRATQDIDFLSIVSTRAMWNQFVCCQKTKIIGYKTVETGGFYDFKRNHKSQFPFKR